LVLAVIAFLLVFALFGLGIQGLEELRVAWVYHPRTRERPDAGLQNRSFVR